MAIKKLRQILLAVFATLLAVAATASFAACDKKNDKSEEADYGVYYYDYADDTEYTLTIEKDNKIKVNFGTEKSGTYTLKDTALEITADGEKISATYSDGKITLTEDGKTMTFIKKTEYTVSFETNGGSAVTVQTVINGKKATNPEAPVKAGYDFAGWYTDPNFSESSAYDFGSAVSGNLTLYAKWEYIPVVNTITYDQTNGTTANSSKEVTEGLNFELEVPSVADGYTFIGWYTEAENGVRLTDETGKSLDVWNKDYGDITVYSHIEEAFVYEETEDENGYAVSASTAISAFETLTVPAYHNGKPVTEVADFTAAASVKTVNLPSSIVKVEPSAFSNLKNLEAIEVYEVENGAVNYKSADGVLFSADGHTLVKYPLAKGGESYVIPAAVTEIADQAFSDIRETGSYYQYFFTGTLTEVTLPSNLQKIGNQAFFRRGNLRVVKFNGNKSNVDWTIGDGAFSDMYLQSFPFNETLVSIGDSAFYYSWTYLINVRFEDDVVLSSRLKKIGDSAFEGCSWLGEITIPASCEYLGSAAFSGTRIDSVTIEHGSKITEIADETFYGCQFEEIYIPSTVTRIGDSAFESCDCLTSITIPEGVTYIGDSAFEDCTEITTLRLPSGLKTIGDSAFASMESLISINIPKTVTSFGDGVFTGCDSLELDNVEIEEGNPVIAIEDGVMYSADKKNLLYYPANRTSSAYVMPATLETIPDGLFRNNEYLTSVTLSESLTKIPNSAFYGTKIKTITIPSSVVTIESEAFRRSALTEVVFAPESNLTTIREYAFGYTSIRTIVLPAKLEKLESSVFAYCTLLTSVTFTGNSLKAVSDGTFNGDTALKNVTLSDGITSISSSAFKDCSAVTEIVLPKNLVDLSSDAFDGVTALESISISDENATYRTVNGALYSKDGKTLVLYAGTINKETGKDAAFTAPDGLENIGERAFYKRNTIESVDLTGVKYIGARAFASCSALTEVNLSGVKTIDEYAFSGCSSLVTADLTTVTAMNVGVFNSCSSLESVVYGDMDYIPENTFSYCTALTGFDFTGILKIGKDSFSGAGLTSAVLDENLTELGEGAFASSKLTEIAIPSKITALNGTFSRCYNLRSVTLNNVTELNSYAFLECTSLTSVDASNVVKIGTGAFNGCTKLSSIKLGKVTEIAGYAFNNCSSLLTITLPETLTQIADGSFNGADKLLEVINLSSLDVVKGESGNGGVAKNALSVKTSGTSDIATENGYNFMTVGDKNYLVNYSGSDENATLPASYKGENYSIYKNALKGSSFVSLTISGGIDEIGEGAFSNSKLVSVNISGITTTGENMFSGCTRLSEVTIGEGVASIAKGTFSGCRNLIRVTLGDDLTTIGDEAFKGCVHLKTLTVPASVESVSESSFSGCYTLSEIINLSQVNLGVTDESGNYKYALNVKTEGSSDLVNENGYVFITVKGNNYLLGYEGTDKNLTLPESYKGETYEVYKYAFYYVSTLGDITVNGGVKAFGNSSFYGTSMTSLTIGDNVNAVIGSEAFYFNTDLITVTIGNGVTSIGSEAFSNSTKIKTVVIGSGVTEIGEEAFAYCNKLEDLTIGSNVKTIGEKAFYYSSLKDVVIPASVDSMGTKIFDYCSSLNSITVDGQKALDIIIGSLNTFMSKAKILKVKEGLTVNEAKLDEIGMAKATTENGYIVYSK